MFLIDSRKTSLAVGCCRSFVRQCVVRNWEWRIVCLMGRHSSEDEGERVSLFGMFRLFLHKCFHTMYWRCVIKFTELARNGQFMSHIYHSIQLMSNQNSFIESICLPLCLPIYLSQSHLYLSIYVVLYILTLSILNHYQELHVASIVDNIFLATYWHF